LTLCFTQTIPSPNLKNDFYVCWVEAPFPGVRVAKNPRNALGFAIAQPNLQKMSKIFALNPFYQINMEFRGAGATQKQGLMPLIPSLT
jgi:hypothetical protein